MKRLWLTLLFGMALLSSGDAQNVGMNGCNAASLSVSNTSTNVQLSKCGPAALVLNVGSTEAFYVLGATSATAATTSNFSIPGNSYQLVSVGENGQWFAAVTASSTTTLRITQGTVQ
jgi:hypothetical protein